MTQSRPGGIFGDISIGHERPASFVILAHGGHPLLAPFPEPPATPIVRPECRSGSKRTDNFPIRASSGTPPFSQLPPNFLYRSFLSQAGTIRHPPTDGISDSATPTPATALQTTSDGVRLDIAPTAMLALARPEVVIPTAIPPPSLILAGPFQRRTLIFNHAIECGLSNTG